MRRLQRAKDTANLINRFLAAGSGAVAYSNTGNALCFLSWQLMSSTHRPNAFLFKNIGTHYLNSILRRSTIPFNIPFTSTQSSHHQSTLSNVFNSPYLPLYGILHSIFDSSQLHPVDKFTHHSSLSDSAWIRGPIDPLTSSLWPGNLVPPAVSPSSSSTLLRPLPHLL